MLRDNDLGAALVQVGDDGVAVEGLVGDQRFEGQTFEERRYANRVEALAGQQDEAHKIAERIGEGEDFSCYAAFGAVDGRRMAAIIGQGWPTRLGAGRHHQYCHSRRLSSAPLPTHEED